MEYNLGDIVRTKKQHPCGSKLWEITRVGVDFKLKCQGCGHVVMLPREKALKAITKKMEKGTMWYRPLKNMYYSLSLTNVEIVIKKPPEKVVF